MNIILYPRLQKELDLTKHLKEIMNYEPYANSRSIVSNVKEEFRREEMDSCLS